MIDLMTKTYVSAGAVPACRFVKANATEGQRAVATAAADAVVGLSRREGVDGQRFDVALMGEHVLEYGGVVAVGARLTSDGTGRGIAATTAGQRVSAIALEPGGAGTKGRVLLCLGATMAV
jgi:hypothetical protein